MKIYWQKSVTPNDRKVIDLDDYYYTEDEVDAKLGSYLSISHPANEVTAGKIVEWNTAYTQISESKSYIEEITTTDWNSDKKYAVTVSGLKTSDTVILDGDNEIFAEYGLDAVIGTNNLANKLIFSVGVKPSNSITIKYSIIKTGSGT